MNFRCHMQGRKTEVKEIVNWNFISSELIKICQQKLVFKYKKKKKKGSDMSMIKEFFAAWQPQPTQDHNGDTSLLCD